jgi:hypothetical protein
MRVLIVIALGVATLVFWEARRELGLDRHMSSIAGEIAGRPVHVDCPGFLRGLVDISGNGGSVMFDANGRPSSTAHLETSVCHDLAGYRSTRKRADFACVYSSTRCSEKTERAVYAALVLSHEAQHLRGIQNEGEAQCYAIQMLPIAAERLGSPATEASAIATHFLTVDQPLMPSDYALPGTCVDGSDLDLHPHDSTWP